MFSFAWRQLCINYCNEKLNNHFNEHVFKGEIATYAAEGVVVPNLVFKDNKPILDFIEGKGDGIYSILDEQVRWSAVFVGVNTAPGGYVPWRFLGVFLVYLFGVVFLAAKMGKGKMV